ncbi:HD domain-containing protein [Acrocarpospora phusangensis]|nr:HD domain-containing protein [Acrocarpospora phusangensis]
MSLRAVLPATCTVEQVEQIERAHAVAAYWHRGQKRKSCDPYIVHPVAVAVILAELGADWLLLCAGLLHDVPEDTDCPESLLRAEFGDDLVDFLGEYHAWDHTSTSSVNERILTLKLADRLHNMRTIDVMPPEMIRLRSRETLEIIVPVAARLGLDEIRLELESLARARYDTSDGHGIGLAFHAISTGAVILPPAARARYLEEWLSDLHSLPDRPTRRRFTVQLLAGMPRLAAVLRWHRLGHRELTDAARARLLLTTWWLLRSNLRVWALFTPLLIWMVLMAGADNPGDALAMLITVPPVIGAGIEWLRPRVESAVSRRR